MSKQFYTLLSFILLVGISFPTQAQYQLNGDAIDLGDDCFQLTDEVLTQAGSFWALDQVNLEEDFLLKFSIYLGNTDCATGADGVVFALQSVSTSVGTSGGELGFGGIEPSLGIEFDTWQNADFGDPVFDHVAIIQNGSVNHNTGNTLDGPVQSDPDDPEMEDEEWHSVLISWDAATTTIDVYFDCNLRLSYTGDIVEEIFGSDPMVFWGFTGATGGACNIQQVCFEYSQQDKIDDATICSGGSVQFEVNDSGFEAITWFPTNGLNDANIANPVASPTETTTYTVVGIDECGSVIDLDEVTVFVDGGSDPGTLSDETALNCNETDLTIIPLVEPSLADGEEAVFILTDSPTFSPDIQILDCNSTGVFNPIDLGLSISDPLFVYIVVGAPIEGCLPDLSTGCFSVSNPQSIIFVDSSSDAGTLSDETLLVCSGADLTITPLVEPSLSAGEEAVFILTATPDFSPNTEVLACNSTGVFNPTDLGLDTNNPLFVCIVVGLPTEECLPNLGSGCFAVSNPQPFVLLDPIAFEVDESCDFTIGDYTVFFSITGGLPSYDNAATYDIVGTVATTLAVGETEELFFAQGTTNVYELIVIEDGNGCGGQTLSEEFYCEKTPIELVSYTGRTTEQGNQLMWETASESNNDYFTLYRSTNGFDFEPIAQVQGTGNSTTFNNYSYLDKNAPMGLVYYQLTQTDFNGTSVDLGVVKLQSSTTNTYQINQTNTELSISVVSSENTNFSAVLVDMNGRQMATVQEAIAANSQQNIFVPTHTLSTGIYLLQISVGDQIQSEKIWIH